MGQPQLLPSKFLRYAVDGDADGRRDVWHSVPDSLASIANYLREHGWKPDVRWGFEASLPQAVACTLEGPRQGRPMQEWLRLGLTPAAGGTSPEWNGNTTAFLVMPAGRLGPAFLMSAAWPYPGRARAVEEPRLLCRKGRRPDRLCHAYGNRPMAEQKRA